MAVEEKELEDVLAERGARYGTFLGRSFVSQALKRAIRSAREDREPLDCDQQEAMDMICDKMSRIAYGDSNYADSWLDIAGYAMLVADRLRGRTG